MSLDRRLIPVALLTLVLAGLAACAPGSAEVDEALANGAVASAHPLATDVGVRILERGGNAVDAAVAVHLALAVVFPSAGNIGGGGFMLIHRPGDRDYALDYRETAPAAAGRDLFLDSEGNVVAGLSLHSHLAAGVPGTVSGLWLAHHRFGSLPWSEVVWPAIELAEDGFVLDEWTATSFAEAAASFARLDERYRGVNNFAEYFGGAAGERLRQRELAQTLRLIAEQGPAGFYHGRTAALIVEEMRRGEGLITLEDLDNYQAVWREPLEGTFRGLRVVSMPPPSSGGVALIEMLNMLEQFEIQPWHGLEHLNLVAEIEKRAFADRSEFLGDSDFHPVPIRPLIGKPYAIERAAGIEPGRRSDPKQIAPGPAGRESAQTTHYTIVDSSRMAVSNTTTLNGSYGSGIVVRGAGFLLNNEMDDFSAKPGVPNMFGVTGGEANAVEAGKRMLSSMTPAFVYDREEKLWLAVGSPGGPTIITTVMQVLVNVIDYGMTLEEAVAAPRFHHQWPPREEGRDDLVVERPEQRRLPDELLEEVRRLGYTLREVDRLGDVQAVEVRGARALGVSDPRLIGEARAAGPVR